MRATQPCTHPKDHRPSNSASVPPNPSQVPIKPRALTEIGNPLTLGALLSSAATKKRRRGEGEDRSRRKAPPPQSHQWRYLRRASIPYDNTSVAARPTPPRPTSPHHRSKPTPPIHRVSHPPLLCGVARRRSQGRGRGTLQIRTPCLATPPHAASIRPSSRVLASVVSPNVASRTLVVNPPLGRAAVSAIAAKALRDPKMQSLCPSKLRLAGLFPFSALSPSPIISSHPSAHHHRPPTSPC